MLSLGLSITSPAVMRGRVYDPASSAIFAAFSAPASGERKVHIDTFVRALKAAGIWDDLDVLHVPAAADSQAARINWKAPGTFTAAAVNAPIFVADRGYSGDGSSARLNTAWTPSTNGVKYTLNDASMALWSRTPGAAAAMDVGYNALPAAGIFCRSAANQMVSYINSGTTTVAANTDGSGFFMSQRRAANDVRLFRNGSQIGSSTSASTGLPAQPFWLCGANPNQISTRQESLTAFGASLVGKEAAFYAAALAYMQAVGAA